MFCRLTRWFGRNKRANTSPFSYTKKYHFNAKVNRTSVLPFVLGVAIFPVALHIITSMMNTAKALEEDTTESSDHEHDALTSEDKIKLENIQEIIETQQQIQKEMQENQQEGNSTPVYRIVLTGGPCGGKSTAMATISDRLLSLGFRVFRVPEAATLLITGTGLNPGALEENESRVFEGSLVKTKMALEEIFYQIAKASSQPSVIICDRGTMDTKAYMKEHDWEILLDEFNWNVVDLRDRRYDAVIHMVTAAIGAEKFYTTENNAARSENLNEARDLDFKVLNAWVGHPHIRIIDNSTNFKRKIQRVEEVICQIVGAPRPAQTDTTHSEDDRD